jgi:hypothetical protein
MAHYVHFCWCFSNTSLKKSEDLLPDDLWYLLICLFNDVASKCIVLLLNRVNQHCLEDPRAVVDLMKKDLNYVLGFGVPTDLLERRMHYVRVEGKLKSAEHVNEAHGLVVHQCIVQRRVSELILFIHDLLGQISKVDEDWKVS